MNLNRAQIKKGVFALEALNSLSTTYYFYYIFFFLQEQFGFGSMRNLQAAAGIGAVYAAGSFFCGRFAQRFGYFSSLKIGFGLMFSCMVAGSSAETLPAHIIIGILNTIGMCFTWPALEALVSENEPREKLKRYIGIYNVVWAGGGAVAYFTGGAVLDYLGGRGIFLIPAVIFAVQFMGAAWLSPHEPVLHAPNQECASDKALSEEAVHAELPAKTFLWLGWLANPFAYIAINSLLPVMPTIAKKLELTPTEAGIFGSLWFFMRAFCFVALACWTKWHYKFRWIALSFGGMTVSFTTLLLSSNIAVLLAAQLVFGTCVGVLYYSSLFYSMDVSDTKGEHGGIHEAIIGAGNCLGPAIGAAALAWFPHPQSGAWAVTLLLLGGFGALFKVRQLGRKHYQK